MDFSGPIRSRSIRGMRTSPESPDCSTTCACSPGAPPGCPGGSSTCRDGIGNAVVAAVASAMPAWPRSGAATGPWTSAGGAASSQGFKAWRHWTPRCREAQERQQERHQEQSSLESAYERNSSIKDHCFHVDFDRHRYPQPSAWGFVAFGILVLIDNFVVPYRPPAPGTTRLTKRNHGAVARSVSACECSRQRCR